MAEVSVTNTLANGDVPAASLWNTNYTDITTWLNNRYNGTDTWLNMKVSATATNPVDVTGSGSSTEVSINNSATDGDPLLTFKLSGTQTHVIGVDDSDSDFLKFGTTGLTTNVAMQIPTTGAQVRFANGNATTPSVVFIGSADTGLFQPGASQFGVSVAGSTAYSISTTTHTWSVGGTGQFELADGVIRSVTDNDVNLGSAAKRWIEVFAVAGSINTSHSSTKEDITPLVDFHIPPGVRYKRSGRYYIGYLNDHLPLEARPKNEQGEFDITSNYEAAVVGELCAGWHSHDRRIDNLEKLMRKRINA